MRRVGKNDAGARDMSRTLVCFYFFFFLFYKQSMFILKPTQAHDEPTKANTGPQ